MVWTVAKDRRERSLWLHRRCQRTGLEASVRAKALVLAAGTGLAPEAQAERLALFVTSRRFAIIKFHLD